MIDTSLQPQLAGWKEVSVVVFRLVSALTLA